MLCTMVWSIFFVNFLMVDAVDATGFQQLHGFRNIDSGPSFETQVKQAVKLSGCQSASVS